MLTQRFIALLIVLLTLPACVPGTPAITGYFDPAQAEIPSRALPGVPSSVESAWFVDVAQADLAARLELHPYEISVQGIEASQSQTGLFIVRLVAQDSLYEYHALGDSVLLVSDAVPLASTNVGDATGAALVARLNGAGLWAEVTGRVSEPALSVEGYRISTLNDSELQLFEYADEARAEAEAARLSTGAQLIATTQPLTHLYRQGNVLLLYTGNDPVVLALLEHSLGMPLASASR